MQLSPPCRHAVDTATTAASRSDPAYVAFGAVSSCLAAQSFVSSAGGRRAAGRVWRGCSYAGAAAALWAVAALVCSRAPRAVVSLKVGLAVGT